ncbi:MAG: SIMPL domain-containing protein, partial [Bacteriovorax sp.]|nr:SIMPL domain-containing protein [Bacteriovorax sp.]
MKCFKEYTPKEVIVLLLVIGVIGLGTISILRERLVRVDRDLVTVRSEGKIYARPDVANISFGFKSDTKKEAKDAINEGSQKMSEIISALKKWGIEERDIKTTMYDLRAVYEYP